MTRREGGTTFPGCSPDPMEYNVIPPTWLKVFVILCEADARLRGQYTGVVRVTWSGNLTRYFLCQVERRQKTRQVNEQLG